MKNKILTIVGTRPEIIRLSVIIKKLDTVCTNIVVDTGQNYSKNLNDIFWEQLNLRNPDYEIVSKSETTADQLSKIFLGVEKVILAEKPEAALILGDTYSGLSSIICERYGIPVYHMEAGNRCWHDHVPEEKNRKVIDSISTFNLPYTSYSYDNLKKLGSKDSSLCITGNPIYEVISYYAQEIEAAVVKYEPKTYGLATFHRAECVDNENNLKNIVEGLSRVAKELSLDIICSIHPRTRSKIDQFGIKTPSNLVFVDAFGFFEFIKLEKNAKLILTDSGTVSEEACILDVPCVTLREVTERQELIDCGSTMLSGYLPENILEAAKTMVKKEKWIKPEGYLWYDVSNRVIDKVLE
jgi:UDP-N-acetylglucosamine 2-epimerase (non-hydrolysing)